MLINLLISQSINIPYEHVGKKEEEHKGGERQPAVYDSVAFEFV